MGCPSGDWASKRAFLGTFDVSLSFNRSRNKQLRGCLVRRSSAYDASSVHFGDLTQDIFAQEPSDLTF